MTEGRNLSNSIKKCNFKFYSVLYTITNKVYYYELKNSFLK